MFVCESTAKDNRLGCLYLSFETADKVDWSGDYAEKRPYCCCWWYQLRSMGRGARRCGYGRCRTQLAQPTEPEFEVTSMGKTGHLGPAPASAEDRSRWQMGLSTSATDAVSLRGADLYRLNCQSCHGETGQGAPPEINSLINPCAPPPWPWWRRA